MPQCLSCGRSVLLAHLFSAIVLALTACQHESAGKYRPCPHLKRPAST